MQVTIKTLEEHSKQIHNALEKWFDFVSSVFTSTPISYFVNHFVNDPRSDTKGIFVAVDDQSKEIVATVRVFDRLMYVDNKVIHVGGIGEVSTQPEFRRRGLAKQLLLRSIDYMKDNGMILSSLHTGSAAPVYESCGWVRVPILYGTINVNSTIEKSTSLVTQRVSDTFFSNPDNIAQLIAMHEKSSSELDGTFARFPDNTTEQDHYWSNWVKTEATLAPNVEMYIASSVDSPDEIQAYLIVRWSNTTDKPKIIIREFISKQSISESLTTLTQILGSIMSEKKLNSIYVKRVPCYLATEWKSTNTNPAIEIDNTDDKDFIMYQELTSDKVIDQLRSSQRHHFWQTDSF